MNWIVFWRQIDSFIFLSFRQNPVQIPSGGSPVFKILCDFGGLLVRFDQIEWLSYTDMASPMKFRNSLLCWALDPTKRKIKKIKKTMDYIALWTQVMQFPGGWRFWQLFLHGPEGSSYGPYGPPGLKKFASKNSGKSKFLFFWAQKCPFLGP